MSEQQADQRVGLATMPSDWMGDLPKSLSANEGLMKNLKKGAELNYLQLDTLYLKEKIENRKLEWLLTLFRGIEFERKSDIVTVKPSPKRPSQYWEEFEARLAQMDEKIEKIYSAVTK